VRAYVGALLRRTFLCIVIGTGLAASAAAQESAQGRPAPGGDVPSRETVKACFKSTGTAECLDDLFREFLQTRSTLEALQLVQRFEAEDGDLRRDCHPIVHAIGRETFRLTGNIHNSFSACDQTCHSGCYHGSVERFLRGDDVYTQTSKHPSQAELKQKAAAACDSGSPLRLRFQCLHGLGHALMFFSAYDLDRSLEACDALADDWSRQSCYGGVFMENVFNARNEKKNFSETDYHYPCNRVDSKYRRECYVMQTSRMIEMGLSTHRLFEECDKAGEYRIPCALSVGRDLSNDARTEQTKSAAQKCELGSGDNRIACVRGVIYALIDNTWDGRYALPFCSALGESADQESCFKDSVEYLRTVFEKPAAEIVKDCSRHAAESRRCMEFAARSSQG
jgi:hypothetical protein